jgi:hypothetical protein
MAKHHVVSTTNFDFFADEGPFPAGTIMDERARALQATCERDFSVLAGRFGTAARFGSGNRLQVLVDATLGMFSSGTLGDNAGFAEGGQTEIRIAGSAPVFANHSQQEIDEALRAALAAELAEVFLDLRSQSTPTLSPGYADGEALSRVVAAELHPLGYQVIGRTATQNDAVPRFPASHWLNQTNPPRRDWVSDSYHSDGDPPSIGCGILFLYFLHTQLRHSWGEIVQALGSTLADTYHALGHAGSAFEPFNGASGLGVLGQVFPVSQVYDLPGEDVFPLLDPTRRKVEIAVGEPGGRSDDPFAGNVLDDGFVDISPGIPCPVERYEYWVYALVSITSVSAIARGFGQPVFRWTVEGHPVAPGTWDPPTYLDFLAAGWDDDPKHPYARVPHPAVVSAKATATAPYAGMPGGDLQVTVLNGRDPATPAHLDVAVTLEVTEKALPTQIMSSSTWVRVDTKELRYCDSFYKDRDDCAARRRELMRRYTHVKEIVLLRTLPDPPPPWVQRGIEVSARLEEELRVLYRENPDFALALADELGLSGESLKAEGAERRGQ